MADDGTGNGSGFFREALGAGVVLAVAVLAAVGVSGDLLARMSRNAPWLTFLAIGGLVALAGLGVIVTIVLDRSTDAKIRSVSAVGAALGTIALILVVLLGADSQDNRENPAVTLSMSDAELSVTLAMSGLRSNETVELLVVATNATGDALLKSCLPRDTYNPPDGKLLSRTVAGPDAAGVVAATFTMPAPAEQWDAYCAYAVPEGRRNQADSELRSGWMVLFAPPTSASTSAPVGTSGGG